MLGGEFAFGQCLCVTELGIYHIRRKYLGGHGNQTLFVLSNPGTVGPTLSNEFKIN